MLHISRYRLSASALGGSTGRMRRFSLVRRPDVWPSITPPVDCIYFGARMHRVNLQATYSNTSSCPRGLNYCFNSRRTARICVDGTPDFVCMCIVYTPTHLQAELCSWMCCSDCFSICGFWTIGVFRVKLVAGAAVLWGLSEFTVVFGGLGLTVCWWRSPMGPWGLRHVSADDLIHWNTQKEIIDKGNIKTDMVGVTLKMFQTSCYF